MGDVDSGTPADATEITKVLGGSADLICYFGHGDEDHWLTSGAPTIDAGNVSAAAGKAILSIACRAGRNLGPDAITAGVISWLGFTIAVPVIAPHKTHDPIGEAIVRALAGLGGKGTMQQARDDMAAEFDQLVDDYDTGKFSTHPAAPLGYFAAMCLRDHVVLHGKTSCQPLP